MTREETALRIICAYGELASALVELYELRDHADPGLDTAVRAIRSELEDLMATLYEQHRRFREAP